MGKEKFVVGMEKKLEEKRGDERWENGRKLGKHELSKFWIFLWGF